MMLALRCLKGQADVTSGLAGLFVPDSAQLGRKSVPAQVSGKLHTAIISSRTK